MKYNDTINKDKSGLLKNANKLMQKDNVKNDNERNEDTVP